MDAKLYLLDYVKKTSPTLKRIFEKEGEKVSLISPIASEMMKFYLDFMGGKNIRGALTRLGYECFGGKNEKAVLRASLMVEVTHAFLLMHDDIMDQDSLRRGLPTIHVRYGEIHRERYTKGDFRHYGLCMALNLGDAGFALSNLILADSDFSSEIKERVLRKFSRQILTTSYGQAIDVSLEHTGLVTEDDVMKVHHYKTANYTITGPLQYGALFAGATERTVEKIEKYGLPVGIAFQLRDDELGLFSDEKTLGKPIGSDVREDKNTILHIEALELAQGEDKRFLSHAYGNANLSFEDIKRVQEITIKTGALSYSQKMAKELVEKGKKHVAGITKNSELRDTLYKMADFMIERTS